MLKHEDFKDHPQLLKFLESPVRDMLIQEKLEGCHLILDRSYPMWVKDWCGGNKVEMRPLVTVRDLVRITERDLASSGITWESAMALQRSLKSWGLCLGMVENKLEDWLLLHTSFKGRFLTRIHNPERNPKAVKALHEQVDWLLSGGGSHNIRHGAVLRSVVTALNGSHLLIPTPMQGKVDREG